MEATNQTIIGEIAARVAIIESISTPISNYGCVCAPSSLASYMVQPLFMTPEHKIGTFLAQAAVFYMLRAVGGRLFWPMIN